MNSNAQEALGELAAEMKDDPAVARELVAVLTAELKRNPTLAKETAIGILDAANQAVPINLVDRENLADVASSVVTEQDIVRARMVLPPGTISYAVRRLGRPRKANVFIGPYDSLMADPRVRLAMEIMTGIDPRDGGLVTRAFNAPKMSDGETVGHLPVPVEEVDSIWVGMADEEGVHPREVVELSTTAGRLIRYDPLCPEDPEDADSKLIDGGRLTVKGGVRSKEGFAAYHVYNPEKNKLDPVHDVVAQQFCKMGHAPGHPKFTPPEPYGLHEAR